MTPIAAASDPRSYQLGAHPLDIRVGRDTFPFVTTVTPPSPLRPDLRAEWLLAPGLTFLNHGSFGAVPRAVFEAQDQWRRRIEADPIEMLGRRCPELVAAAKVPVGRRLGMAPADFGFVTNATEGVNAVLRSLPLSAGDELLTTNHVYHAVRQTMRLAARRAGAAVREADVPLPVASAEAVVERVMGGVGPRTRLVVIDHITSPTGLVFPAERIVAECRSRGVDVLVDGAHAPAQVALDVAAVGATYYAANLHKWCCAPKGTAVLWVTPDRQPEVHPTVVSHHLDEGFAAEFGWQGTRDKSAWLTAPAAIAFLEDLGWDAVRKHNHAMAVWAHRMLVERWGVEPISPMDGSLLGSMATVRLPGKLAGSDCGPLQQRLHDDFRIEVPVVGWGGGQMIRVSCHAYNVPDDYERLASVIAGLA